MSPPVLLRWGARSLVPHLEVQVHGGVGACRGVVDMKVMRRGEEMVKT